MNILIDTIRISGFRGIKDLEMSLPRVTVLIGPNNSGKTSLIKALQLALGDYSRFLTEEDFHIGPNDKKIKEIRIDVRIVPVDAEGNRIGLFAEEWAAEFGDKIQAEANGRQFIAIRTRSKPNPIKGSFDTNRYTLDKWPDTNDWLTEKPKESKLPTRLNNVPFISIDAQRDIHQELKEKTSFVGRVLSSIEYNHDDIASLETIIKKVNEEAIRKSNELLNLKSHLEKLNQSISGTGNAEITPFPKKIRDLSKHFSIHFGENTANSFSMEYHGMGTRSWASMLTVKAFIDLMTEKHINESEPFFSILAAEEPEAHLHPNAQKTLYRQLTESKGQLIISTHSPYLASMADVSQIRSLSKSAGGGTTTHQISHEMTHEDKKIVAREIMAKRGEILFSRVIILCEGVTEEQVIPAMFEVYDNKSFWDIGASCISVGGKNYPPFVKLACSFGIPTCIISDNDGHTKKEIEVQTKRLKKDTKLELDSDMYNIQYLGDGNDFEAELINHGLRDEIIEALVSCETKGSDNPKYRNAKLAEIRLLSTEDLIIKMRNSKSSYSGFLADVLIDNPNNKTIDERLPPAIKNTFETVKRWLSK